MYLACPNCPAGTTSVVRNGHFFRSSDSRKIQCFKCKACARYFSSATFSECYRQKKRRINEPLRDLLCKRMALRDAARFFKVSRTTIARRLVFLGEQARKKNQQFLEYYQHHNGAIDQLQFDDLITVEHTKCKPVTVTVVVQEKTRIVLDYSVAQIPASGHLAQISRKKYGKRADHSYREREKLFKRLTAVLGAEVRFRTDEHKAYPAVIKKHFPNAVHLTHKRKPSRTNGQGEMKKTGRDPLFSINQSFGMFRDKLSRLTRQSWNVSKKLTPLENHLAIYIESHNRSIWEKMEKKRLKNLAG